MVAYPRARLRSAMLVRRARWRAIGKGIGDNLFDDDGLL